MSPETCSRLLADPRSLQQSTYGFVALPSLYTYATDDFNTVLQRIPTQNEATPLRKECISAAREEELNISADKSLFKAACSY